MKPSTKILLKKLILKEVKQFALERKLGNLKEASSKNFKIEILPNSVERDMDSAIYTGYVNFDVKIEGTSIALETNITLISNSGSNYEVQNFEIIAKPKGKLKNPDMEDLVDNFQDYLPENELKKLEDFAKKMFIKTIERK